MKDKTFSKDKITDLLFILIPVLLLAYFCFYMANYSQNFVDSDMSSELILAKLVSDENKIITRSWYYSTEIRFLNIQLVFAPLFKIFTGWHTVRTVGSTILMALLAAGAYLCGRACGISHKMSIIMCSFLLFPFWGNAYAWVVMTGSYYVPHMLISFLSVALVFFALRSNSRKAFIVYSAVLSVLALLAGCGGLRQLFILYIPLFLSTFICLLICTRKNITPDKNLKQYAFITTLMFICAGIGYVINKGILGRFYIFYDHSTVTYQSFDINRFSSAISGIISQFGYKTGDELFSVGLIFNATAAIVMLTLICGIVKNFKHPDSCEFKSVMTAIIFTTAISMYIVLYSFTDITNKDHYFLPIIVLSFPVIIKYTEDICRKYGWMKIITACVLCAMLFCGYLRYVDRRYDDNKEKRNAVAVALENGCSAGYGSFWNANVITELSDGKIDMYCWGQDIDTITDINTTEHWLQKVSHDSKKPEGKVLCLFTVTEAAATPLGQSMPEHALVYSSDYYMMYVFDSYEAMIEEIS